MPSHAGQAKVSVSGPSVRHPDESQMGRRNRRFKGGIRDGWQLQPSIATARKPKVFSKKIQLGLKGEDILKVLLYLFGGFVFLFCVTSEWNAWSNGVSINDLPEAPLVFYLKGCRGACPGIVVKEERDLPVRLRPYFDRFSNQISEYEKMRVVELSQQDLVRLSRVKGCLNEHFASTDGAVGGIIDLHDHDTGFAFASPKWSFIKLGFASFVQQGRYNICGLRSKISWFWFLSNLK